MWIPLTASTFVAHVGKTPDIAQAHRIANAGQDKLHFVGPMLLARLQMGRLVRHVHEAVIVIDAQRPANTKRMLGYSLANIHILYIFIWLFAFHSDLHYGQPGASNCCQHSPSTMWHCLLSGTRTPDTRPQSPEPRQLHWLHDHRRDTNHTRPQLTFLVCQMV